MISTVGLTGRPLAGRTVGKIECWVGVCGEESTTESGDTSELVGDESTLREG